MALFLLASWRIANGYSLGSAIPPGWILQYGFWDDGGAWRDYAVWID